MATVAMIPKTRTLFLGTDPSGKRVELPARDEHGRSRGWIKMAIIGVSSSGKSYAAAKLAEGWLHAQVPLSILDPSGVWWGLRAGSDGLPEAGLQIPVYGGLHGDTVGLPEAVSAAQAFAGGVSAVFDFSEMDIPEMQAWVAEFCRELMRPGTQPSEASHILVEEAVDFLPQTGTLSKYQRECKAALGRILRVGRNRGWGATLVAQRCADLDKRSLTQVDTLLLMRLAAGIDRKPIREWIANNASTQDKLLDMLGSMGQLPTGEGWLWSPTWAKMFTRVRVGKRETFHPGPDDQQAEMLPIALPSTAVAGDGLDAIGKIIKFFIKAALVLAGLWLAWKILSVVAAVVGLALLLWIVFGK